jgi:hypothetical protein
LKRACHAIQTAGRRHRRRPMVEWAEDGHAKLRVEGP